MCSLEEVRLFYKKKNYKAQPREWIKPNLIVVPRRDRGLLQSMNKQTDTERDHPTCRGAMVPGSPEVHCIFIAVCVCVLPARGCFTRRQRCSGCAWCWIFAAGGVTCIRVTGLFADSLQSVQGAFDVADLSSQGVYGLHGTIQLLAASHQSVHTLYAHVHRLSQAVNRVSVGLNIAYTESRHILDGSIEASHHHLHALSHFLCMLLKIQ